MQLQMFCILMLGALVVTTDPDQCRCKDKVNTCVIHDGVPGVNGLPGRDGWPGPKGEKGEPAIALKGVVNKVGNKIFTMNGKEIDFKTTVQTCQHYGGSIATPMNEEENEAIVDILTLKNRYAYLGLKAGSVPGKFHYLDGSAVNYTKWYKNEPNGGGAEKCMEMYTDGTWNDKTCNQHRLIVCEF
ncbi:pulmonary surfactant-associated protein A-like isoform X3 [Rhineura floridana]|uniref:pulmonary surfactant-associated protein A-like isoform X3 n=1 Tax=Rhineura floridana TaxID=261503 RepID=UPI002AC872FA|nr:pulmonary surfactant-associated protein A-like isoform X3 [Rhineura floridana]